MPIRQLADNRPILLVNAYQPAGGQTTIAGANLIKNVIIKYPGDTLLRMLF